MGWSYHTEGPTPALYPPPPLPRGTQPHHNLLPRGAGASRAAIGPRGAAHTHGQGRRARTQLPWTCWRPLFKSQRNSGKDNPNVFIDFLFTNHEAGQKQSVNTEREQRVHSSIQHWRRDSPSSARKATWYDRTPHTFGNRHGQQGITFTYLQKPELHQTAEKPQEQKLLGCSSV